VQGAEAAAWTTCVARVFLVAALFLLLWRFPRAREAGVFRRARPDPELAAEQRRIGYGAGLSYGIEVTAFAGMNIVAGWLGALAIAAWTLVLNVAGVVFMLPLGLASATAVLVGRSVGAADIAGIHRAFRVGTWVTVASLAAVSLAVFALPTEVANIYTTESALVAMVVPALVLACLFFVADGLQNVTAQSLRARGDVWWPTALHFISYIVIMLPLGWWLSTRYGVNGIVMGVIAASLFSAVVLFWRFRALGDHLPPEGTPTA
jgi:MATE family multidrug resistance protein